MLAGRDELLDRLYDFVVCQAAIMAAVRRKAFVLAGRRVRLEIVDRASDCRADCRAAPPLLKKILLSALFLAPPPSVPKPRAQVRFLPGALSG